MTTTTTTTTTTIPTRSLDEYGFRREACRLTPYNFLLCFHVKFDDIDFVPALPPDPESVAKSVFESVKPSIIDDRQFYSIFGGEEDFRTEQNGVARLFLGGGRRVRKVHHVGIDFCEKKIFNRKFGKKNHKT